MSRHRSDELNLSVVSSIAFDAACTHTHAPGTRRHIKGTLELGATIEEIMGAPKLCVVQAVAACHLGVPILAEKTSRRSVKDKQPQEGTKP